MKHDSEIRKDIVSGKVMEKEGLLRFTITPDHQAVPDFKKKLPGIGVYVANSRQALSVAVSKNLFSKAVKQNVKTNPQLVEIVEQLLKKQGLNLISLSRKAGALVTGFEKVCDGLKKAKFAFLLEASNAGGDGRAKISFLAKEVEIFNIYSVEELDAALDKANTVHIAFQKGEMAKTVYNEFKKINQFMNS